MALPQRSQLLPSNSNERVKLIWQKERLFEHALDIAPTTSKMMDQLFVCKLLDKLMKSEENGDHCGTAFWVTLVVKGFGISCLKKYNIVTTTGISCRQVCFSKVATTSGFIL